MNRTTLSVIILADHLCLKLQIQDMGQKFGIRTAQPQVLVCKDRKQESIVEPHKCYFQ